jgi:predicted metalloprotease
LFIESQKDVIRKFFSTAVIIDVNPGLDNIRVEELDQQLMELDNANKQENENLDSTNDETEDATEHENLQHSSHTENPDVNDE